MKYLSTRGGAEPCTGAQAIKKGIAPDGGLYMPERLPSLADGELDSLASLSYPERAARILYKFLDDYDYAEMLEDCRAAYCESSFPGGAAPVHKLKNGNYILELFHGPTCAFKDMALQIMPRLLSRALKMTGEDKCAFILVATSGDTGKAALEGYRDVEQVKIMVYYPVHGVSEIQKLQMASQEGKNVRVCAIEGNFDDAQNGVKMIFGDAELNKRLNSAGYILTSANSINWGRLAPQVVYYISAYLDLVNSGEIKMGEEIDVTVPTGNFGNIFAGYIAKTMGLPIRRLICASNRNNILTDFLKTGIYDRNRSFYTTMSPSMDILISSNLERLLYFVCGSEQTKKYMQSLVKTGRYEISADELEAIKATFVGAYTDEEGTSKEISNVFKSYNYLADTHTAVALSCAEALAENGVSMLTVSTASPYKFAADVLSSLGSTCSGDKFTPLDALCELSGVPVPAPLASLKNKAVRFTKVINPEDMAEETMKITEERYE